jgi:hypothetical protein
MYSLSILSITFLSLTITVSQCVMRGEKTRYSIFCPNPNAHWFGPHNQSILANSNKYDIKYSSDNVQLTIDHLTFDDEGEYICQNNETNHIIKRYRLKVGTIKNVLLLFFISIVSILIFIPIFWFLGKKYSVINQ